MGSAVLWLTGEWLFLNCEAFANSRDTTLIYWLVNGAFPEDLLSSERIVESKEWVLFCFGRLWNQLPSYSVESRTKWPTRSWDVMATFVLDQLWITARSCREVWCWRTSRERTSNPASPALWRTPLGWPQRKSNWQRGGKADRGRLSAAFQLNAH